MFRSQHQTIASFDVIVHSSTTEGRPPIILVHGIGVSSAYFMPFARELARSYSVFVLDLPGYGKTSKPERPLTVVELSEVVAAFIGENNLKDPVVVGQSMGCQVVANLVRNHPQLCAKCVLLGPTVYDKERSIAMQAWRLLQDSLREPLRLNLIVIRDYQRMGAVRYLRTSRYMLRDHIEDYLPQSTIQTLIVRGQKDPIVPHSWVQRLAEATPHARLLEITDAPHVAHYKKPAELAAACSRFIDGAR